MHKKTFSQIDLEDIFQQHQKWLKDKKTGKQACYRDTLFENLDFSNMNFEDAVFEKCSFKYSDFTQSSFKNADLSFSDFSEAHYVLEDCFAGANLKGCIFGNNNLFNCNKIKQYERQYLFFQKIYIFSFVFAVALFLFPELFCDISVSFYNVSTNIRQDDIPYAVTFSSALSCLMSFYFLKINAKNLTEQFIQFPRVFPNGEKRENKIDNSFLKSIFDVQDDENDKNKNMSYIEYDFNNMRRSAICVEHNMFFFSMAILFMEILKSLDEKSDAFFFPLILLPLSFEKYRTEKIYLYNAFASVSCLLFVVFHNYIFAILFIIASILLYPNGKFNSRIILFLYILFVFRVVCVYSLFPKENFVVQEFKKNCDIKNYNISEVVGEKFDGMMLKKLKAVGIDFSNKTFNNSDLSDSDLRCGIFKNTSFHNSVLDNVDFRGAYIEDYTICNAKSYKHIKTDNPVVCVNVPISK